MQWFNYLSMAFWCLRLTCTGVFCMVGTAFRNRGIIHRNLLLKINAFVSAIYNSCSLWSSSFFLLISSLDLKCCHVGKRAIFLLWSIFFGAFGSWLCKYPQGKKKDDLKSEVQHELKHLTTCWIEVVLISHGVSAKSLWEGHQHCAVWWVDVGWMPIAHHPLYHTHLQQDGGERK